MSRRRILGHVAAAMAVGGVFPGRAQAGSDGGARIEAAPRADVTPSAHHGRVSAVAVSSDGRRAVSGAVDGSICLWDTATGERIGRLPRANAAVRHLTFTDDGHYVVTADDGGWIGAWDWQSRRHVVWQLLDGARVGAITAPTLGGGRLAVVLNDRSVSMRSLSTGEEQRRLLLPAPKAPRLAFTDGHRAVALVSDVTLGPDQSALWDLDRQERLARLSLPGYGDYDFSTDGRWLVGRVDADGFELRSASGTIQRWFGGHEGGTNPVVVMGGERFAGSGGVDGTVGLWQIATTRLHETMVIAGPVTALAAGGRATLIAGSLTGVVLIWRPASLAWPLARAEERRQRRAG